MKNKFLFTIVVYTFVFCSTPQKQEPITKEVPSQFSVPELKAVSETFCKSSEDLNKVATYIKTKVGEKTWEEVQDELLRSNKEEDKQESLQLQRGRAVIAKCASLLFSAIPTGSARNLEEIDLKNAKKDIDMSVPFEKVEEANEWLDSLVKESDRVMLLTLLGDPISPLVCRNLPKNESLTCAKQTVKDTTEVMILAEIKNSRKNFSEKGDAALLTDFVRICSGGFMLPESSSPVYEVFQISNKEEKDKFLARYPKVPNKNSDYRSSLRFQVIFYGLHNPAYYLQPGSIRKWVIDREKDFKEKMQKENSEYMTSGEILEFETEGAVLEQWIQAMRHGNSFYYRNKYLFRAMEHIGFDLQKKTPELYSIHKILKRTRPESLSSAYKDFIELMKQGETKKEKSLSKWNENLTEKEFKNIILTQEKIQTDALFQYYQTRKKKKDSIWNMVCR
ncbi:MAG: hypothetical protein N3A69_01655 [Leptospiraceae bacterium]|nr:hypothetical protein [Leptospiraceae bacterium]